MAWSFQIGRLFGIPIRVHLTFFLLLAFFALPAGAKGGPMAGLARALFICALFFCVVLHELGHSLVARKYGVGVESITLLPIGGVSAMERIPDEPRQEFGISVAGPLVSLGVAVVLGAAIYAVGGRQELLSMQILSLEGGWWGIGFFRNLMWTNVLLAIFNMLPAFPMDGGRVLRSVLAQRMDYVRATHIAASVGQAAAFALGFLGLLGNPWLILIALFVYLGAGQEEKQVRVRSLLRSVPVQAAMVSQFQVLSPYNTLEQAVHYASLGYQADFPVVDNERLVGMVTRQAMISGLHERGPWERVGGVMETDFCVVGPGESLTDIYDRLARGKCPIAAVVSDNTVVGIVTPESIQNYMMLAATPQGPPRPYGH
ncbi:MAG: site-2 protease family protein [Armatimonadota bacterium]